MSPQLFPRWSNSLSRVSLAALVLLIVVGTFLFDRLYKSPYVDGRQVIREQPVPFSHKHHVGDDGIDCRYCHVSVENSSFAGIPSMSTCMTCHSQLFSRSQILEPVRRAAATDVPLRWVRVNSLPDFVYFDHGIHVHKGVACDACHGPVERMPLTWRQASLEMRWCLSCHEKQNNARLMECDTCHR